MSIFKSVPGYALEKFLNHGSRELRAKLTDPEESFDEIAAELEDIKLEDIHRLQTWATQESATWEHGNLHGDNKTKAGLTSMIREKAGGYLQRHFANRIYFNSNEPENAIPISYSFEAIKEEMTAISNMLDKINVSNDIITEKFGVMITHFDRKSDQAESYCEPPEVIRRKEYQRCLLRNFICLEDTKNAKQVLVIERCFLDDLGSDFRKTHLTSCVGNRLFKKKGSTTIYILVNVSYHVIAGARIHSLDTRIRNIVGLISDLKLLRHMGVINEKRYISEFGIFKSWAIEYEGLSGTYDNLDGSFGYGSKFVTGEGHVLRKVMSGVKGIGDVISRGVGINPIHLFSFYALFGHVKFIQLMKIAFGIVVGDDGMGNFLEKWRRERIRLRKCKKYADDKAFVKRYCENEENSQSTEVSTEEKARFECLVRRDKMKKLRECEKRADDLSGQNVKRRAIRELKRQACEECNDESSKRRRIITDADATQNIPPI
jgi:hypothetical protein